LLTNNSLSFSPEAGFFRKVIHDFFAGYVNLWVFGIADIIMRPVALGAGNKEVSLFFILQF
jgi:hypothetical protein